MKSTRKESGSRPKVEKLIDIDRAGIQKHLDGTVRSTVEETLDQLLDAEAEALCGGKRHERTQTRPCHHLVSGY